MKIVKINRGAKHTVNILCENGETLCIDSDIMAQTSLKAGDSLSDTDAQKLSEQSDFYRAKSRAMWYLDRADHSEKALYDKLIRASFSEKASAAAVQRLCELGLLDDRRLAFRLAERLSEQNLSKRQIYARLFAKSIPKDIINEALQSLETDERAQIREIIAKKYAAKLEEKNAVQKVYAALVRKGFSYGAVRDVLKAYCEELQYTDGD